MRRLFSAFLFAAMLGAPTLASAHDDWRDHDRREWRDDYRGDGWHDRRDWRQDRWERRRWREARRHRTICQIEWRHGHRERVCYRR